MKITGKRLNTQLGEHIDCDHKIKRKDKKLINKNVRSRLNRIGRHYETPSCQDAVNMGLKA